MARIRQLRSLVESLHCLGSGCLKWTLQHCHYAVRSRALRKTTQPETEAVVRAAGAIWRGIFSGDMSYRQISLSLPDAGATSFFFY